MEVQDHKLVPNADKGEVKNPENLIQVICTRPLHNHIIGKLVCIRAYRRARQWDRLQAATLQDPGRAVQELLSEGGIFFIPNVSIIVIKPRSLNLLD